MGALMGGARRRVAAYCRVSTELELQEGSFDKQMSYYRALIAADPGMELVDIYGDRGCTGRSVAARPEFQRMLADCEAGRIDLILTKSISRFARNLSDCIAVLRRLRQLGVAVAFEKERLNTGDAQGELLLSIFAAMAQEESNSISQSVLWAQEQRNASGRPSFRPSYGYARAERDWAWRVDEAQARRVRQAFDMAAAGACYGDMLRALNALEQAEGTGRNWTYQKLRYLLTNPNYTGDCLTNRYIAVPGGGRRVKPNRGERAQYLIEGHHEPLVSRMQFDAVQQRIRSGALRSTLRGRGASARSERG